ncbi:MAG: Eco57I restriction-modification methylase domain-containing protein [Oscillospiraceae bacterium]|nr:Eco57I restriction-modification methylase domain-containing protein [Oscillospiraceae bacterium]
MRNFDYVIGNPAYNREAQQTSTSDDPIYNYFMDEAYKVSGKVMMITPARFLMNAGKTPAKWNKKMLEDEHLKVMFYEGNSQKVFPSALIPGGIAVTYRDESQNYGAIGQFVYFEELTSIDKKVSAFKEKSLNTIMYNQNKFNLPEVYKEFPELKSQIGSEGKDKRFRQIVLERFPQLFTEEMSSADSMRVLGLVNRKRAYRYIERRFVEEEKWIDCYKVFVPFSNGASGTLSTTAARLISRPVIGNPNEGITQTFIGVGNFNTFDEAKNCETYILSKFARALLGILKVTQGNKPETWAHVPLQDFTKNSDIDWNTSKTAIDKQLYRKYGLNQSEIAFVETHVEEMT